MGKLFLYGRGNKSTKETARAKLTVICPVGLTVHARSAQSLLTFKVVADETGKAVFDNLTTGVWDVTVSGVDNPPTERIVIDDLDCNVKFPYMTIFVTYPRGSTCTCTKGDVVLTAPDRTGSCSFDVYELGDWTVSSTNGVESDTKVVSVTTFDEIKNVKLLHDLYIIDSTGQRQVLDPVEFWGNDDENVKMTINDDGSVSFEFLTNHSDTVVSNMALDLTSYAYVDVTSVCDRESVIKMRLLHPTSSANMSGTWTIDDDTTSHSMECKISTHTGNRLLSIGSYGNASTTLTIYSLLLKYSTPSIINVLYPVGLSCTCSNGDTVLTASDTSGSYSFDIYEPGDWTVSCADGRNTVSEVISVTDFATAFDVDLNSTFTEHNVRLLISNRSELAHICLPSELTTIGDYAFYGCTNLALTSIPAGITSIGYEAFGGCANIPTLTFEGTPDSIDSNAFYQCTKLRTINVPWTEGAVANAPWGATYATINYNYTGA